MKKNYQKIKAKHPYLVLFLWMLLASLVGITIEYALNRDFIRSGLYTSIGLFLIAALRIKKKNNHKDV